MQPAEPLIEDLKAAMEQLVTDHELCARQSAAAIREVQEKYTWKAKAGQIVNIYHQTCGSDQPQVTAPETAAPALV